MYTNTGFADEVHPAFNRFLNPIRPHEDVMEHIRELCKSVYFYRSFEPIRGLRREFSIVVTMKCNITDHLMKWILQMGEDVVILETEELRKKVIDKIEKMIVKNKKTVYS